MGKRRAAVLVLALVALVVATVGADREEERWPGGGGGEAGYEEEERWPEGGGSEGGYKEEERWPEGGGEEGGTGWREGTERFLLQESKQVVKTGAGEMRVVRGYGSRFVNSLMHIGFITMEPGSFFIPHYLDSSLIFFVRRGCSCIVLSPHFPPFAFQLVSGIDRDRFDCRGARVGHIHKDELVERDLTIGDIYRIEAGSAFYLINTAQGQRLHIVCSIGVSDSLGLQTFQSFFVAGGLYPRSVLAGFDPLTLSTAFNITAEEVGEMLTMQDQGPIVYLTDTRAPRSWSKFLDLEEHQKMAHMRRIVRVRDDCPEEEQSIWSFRKLFVSFFGMADSKKGDKKGRTGKGPDAYNLYDRKPDFKNDYGWSIALDESEYSPLRHDDFGVYLVNLTAGSMMAPHINPTATEYGIVLRGAGTIQVVYPNGSLAMNAKVREGDVFWVPRYFPFCQIASRTGPFEFFGFTTSARNNWPQFLAGDNSLLHLMRGPEFAAAFGMSEERLAEIIDAQRETTILPSPTVAPPDEAAPAKVGDGGVGKVIRSFGSL